MCVCSSYAIVGFPSVSDSKHSACNTEDLGSVPGLGRFPWRREWQPTPVLLSGEIHGQKQATVHRILKSWT